jgi:hypothetical protein
MRAVAAERHFDFEGNILGRISWKEDAALLCKSER